MTQDNDDEARERDAQADFNDPDLDNAEQDERGTQAQDVADDALTGRGARQGGGDSVHGGRTDPAQLIPDDTEDVVDHMNAMDRSGRIDMGAFDGEPESMDDEDGSTPE